HGSTFVDSPGKRHIIYKPIQSGNAKKVKIFPNPSATSRLKVTPESRLISLNEKTEAAAGKKSGKIKYLIDRLNYINFQDETILINFHHKKFDHKVTKHVLPMPCKDARLECAWTDISDLVPVFRNYRIREVLIPDNNKVLLVRPEVVSASRKRIVLKLPRQYEEVNKRRVKRYDCQGIDVRMVQNSVVYRGELMDFSTMAFHIRLIGKMSPTFKWINPDVKVNLIFLSGKDTIYSGECLIFKQSGDKSYRDIVLEPLNFEIQRFKPREHRSARQKLVPSPDAVIRHPLTGKDIQLKILDMSGSGFSVEENEEDAVLLPGLVTPETTLKFASNFTLRCRGQVIYSVPEEKERHAVKCGITILDMAINDHMNLLAILGQAEDGNSYLCDSVNMDLLWDFFFRNGIIYSDSYELLHDRKDQVKKTYENLYTRNPHIARHFIYQDKGMILGHLAMLRFYEKTWILCLHSSQNTIPQVHQRLALLNQAARYVYESYSFASAHLDYLISYYDSNDKFALSVYGSVARNTQSPKGCSIDSLAYFRHRREDHQEAVLPEGYYLASTTHEDLAIMESFYEHKSGGLMIQALDLVPGSSTIRKLSNEYLQLGFQRKRYLFSLKTKDQLKAILMINSSDIGVNMADLTSCIKIFVVEPRGLPAEAVYTSLTRICKNLKKKSMPVFVYPANYAGEMGISYEQTFHLWVLDTQYTDQFTRQVKALIQSTEEKKNPPKPVVPRRPQPAPKARPRSEAR
ncbi:MAG: hypothetical protein ACOZBW_07705, partial [Thermodesulfobacteriota bacterium]